MTMTMMMMMSMPIVMTMTRIMTLGMTRFMIMTKMAITIMIILFKFWMGSFTLRNCTHFELTSPKLTGVGPWTLYHRLGPPAGCEHIYNYEFSILCVFDDYDFQYYAFSTITSFDENASKNLP